MVYLHFLKQYIFTLKIGVPENPLKSKQIIKFIKMNDFKINRKLLLLIAVFAFTLSFTACKPTIIETPAIIEVKSEPVITAEEVIEAQRLWGEGVVEIGRVFQEKGDYTEAARKHIEEFYGYNLGIVLFKPTMASQFPFRTDKEGALSYFVAGNPDYPEDHGFAIKPWSAVRWNSLGVKIIGNMAISMGNYFFTPSDGGPEVKVEYSLAYTKDNEGILRIILHGSHLPYSPPVKH